MRLLALLHYWNQSCVRVAGTLSWSLYARASLSIYPANFVIDDLLRRLVISSGNIHTENKTERISISELFFFSSPWTGLLAALTRHRWMSCAANSGRLRGFQRLSDALFCSYQIAPFSASWLVPKREEYSVNAPRLLGGLSTRKKCKKKRGRGRGLIQRR